jgi:hypothetical protein
VQNHANFSRFSLLVTNIFLAKSDMLTKDHIDDNRLHSYVKFSSRTNAEGAPKLNLFL